jgi:hypothetical protein
MSAGAAESRRATTVGPEEITVESSRLTFDGTGDYEAFKMAMKQRLRTRLHLDRQQRALYLFEALRGDALRHVMAGMPAEDDDDEEMGRFAFAKAVEIWKRLDSRYGLSGTTAKTDAITSLMGLRQGKMTVDSFTNEFNKYAPYTGWGDEEIIAAYFRSLRADINMAVGVMHPKSWPEAVRAARRGEELVQIAKPRDPKRSGGGIRGNNYPRQPGRRAREDVRCFNCDQLGHISRDCPARQHGQGKTPTRGRQVRQIASTAYDDCEYELEMAGNE